MLRILHPRPIVQRQLVQHAGGACTLALRAASFDTSALETALAALFDGAPLDVRFVDAIADAGPGGAVRPFIVEASA